MLLGYACLVGSCFRSVPQIVKILQAGSAEGLSLTSNLMELLCYTVTVAYNMQQVGRVRVGHMWVNPWGTSTPPVSCPPLTLSLSAPPRTARSRWAVFVLGYL